MKQACWLFVACALLLAMQGAYSQDAIDIGSRLELFVDGHLIDSFQGGAELELQHPVDQELAIVHDAPWEGNTSAYHTVFKDGDIYRMYYRGSHFDLDTEESGHPSFVCYAESKDGIHWTKPNLGIVEFNGSKENNIIWDGIGTSTFIAFKDANPEAKAEARYKGLAYASENGSGLYPFQSADGIHWELMQNEPVITEGAFDSQNLAFYDQLRGKYVDFHRDFRQHEGKGRVRDIKTCTSEDFLNWTDPEWLEYPGVEPAHLYTNQVTPYFRAPHIYLGFPKRFVPPRKSPAGHPMPGVSDGVFMSSRNGQHFDRWTEAFLRPGLQDERWVNRNNLIAWGVVPTKSSIPGAPDEISIYSTEHYYQGEAARLRRHTLRMDGFVSVNAPLDGGSFVTKPITFVGSELSLNFSTSAAGTVKVEIQDAQGNPIEGYALADCPEIYGDEIAHTVEWESGSDVADLAGKPVRLHFELSDADVYALQFK